MMGWLVKWLWGYRRVSCPRSDSRSVLNIMHSRDLSYRQLSRAEDGSISFEISEKEYKMLLSILDKNDIKVYSVYGRGLPFVCRAHRNRTGLLCGLALYMVLIFSSSLFVWDIKVTSDTRTPHNIIISNLSELGCYEGTFIPSVDFEDLCIDYLERFKDFSWISVNVRGTVAYVEVREKQLHENNSDEPQNLVASHGGVIESCSVYKGRGHVTQGNVVKKGDLLVSGIVENKEGDLRLCHAEGRVMATIDTQLSVEVPYQHESMTYTGKSYEKRRIRFFNLTLPYFGDEIPEDMECTQLFETESAVLFERIELPLALEKDVFYEYEMTDRRYSREEAERAAQRSMREKFDSELPDAELVSVETFGEHTEKAYTLTCKIKCRMDITTPVEIEIG